MICHNCKNNIKFIEAGEEYRFGICPSCGAVHIRGWIPLQAFYGELKNPVLIQQFSFIPGGNSGISEN